MKVNWIIIVIILTSINVIFGQSKKVKVIKVTTIDYYYVYKVIEYNKNYLDTLILLGNREINKDDKEILLKMNKKYLINTRLKSAIRTSDENFMICKPTENILNNVVISNKKSLPVLILNYEEISPEENKCFKK